MTPEERLQKFTTIFSGSERAHGRFILEGAGDNGKVKGRAFTERTPATESDFLAHLQGKAGLGMIPLREDFTVTWGVIDIDDRSIDLVALEKKVAEKALPLTVCRSKSGGAHCYIFFNTPVSATRSIEVLKNWTAALGYPKAEVFPKQATLGIDKHGEPEVGNWINLPYFNGSETNRYAFENGLPITLDRFLGMAQERKCDASALDKRYEIEEAEDETPLRTNGKLTWNDMIPEGERHNELMRRGVCLYKQGYSLEAVTQSLLHTAQNQCVPPMEGREIETIAKWIDANVQKGESPYPQTDQGNGYRFRDSYAGQIIYSQPSKHFMIRDGARFKIDETGKHIQLAKKVALAMQSEAHAARAAGTNDTKAIENHVKKTQSRAGLQNMLWAGGNELAVHPRDLDKDPWLLNVQNGTLDLKTGVLLPHDPARLCDAPGDGDRAGRVFRLQHPCGRHEVVPRPTRLWLSRHLRHHSFSPAAGWSGGPVGRRGALHRHPRPSRRLGRRPRRLHGDA